MLGNIDVAVVPSIFPEPFGYVAVEPLLAGAVVVASRIGGLIDIGENDGLTFFEPNNPMDLASEILRFSEMSKGTLAEFSLRARDHILRRFDNSREVGKFTAACDRLL